MFHIFFSITLFFFRSPLPQSLAALERLIRERAASASASTCVPPPSNKAVDVDSSSSGGNVEPPPSLSSPVAPRIDTKLFVTPAKSSQQEETKVRHGDGDEQVSILGLGRLLRFVLRVCLID